MARTKKAKEKCATKGCRRKLVADGFCAKCAAAAVDLNAMKFEDPEDAARKLSQVELLRLGKAGAELEKSLMHVRLFRYELVEVRQQAEQQLREKLEQMEQERKIRTEQVQHARKQYDDLTFTLSQKYGVADPKKMIVDTETGLIHEADSI
jgi:hypothetical protein